VDLDDARALGAREAGLAVAITMRPDGTPRASVVNAGVLAHPRTGEQVVGFVSRGDARKLDDLRRDARATVVFRSGWDWLAVEGDATIIGPDDADVLAAVRAVYAAAVGGDPDQWAELDSTLSTERHTAVLVRPRRVYPNTNG
jgi:PPOX class probable F420-dependent enzyme